MDENPYRAEGIEATRGRGRLRIRFDLLTLLFVAIGLCCLPGIPVPSGRPLTSQEAFRHWVFSSLCGGAFGLAIASFLIGAASRIGRLLMSGRTSESRAFDSSTSGSE
jgi:hypothetical protein